MTIGQSQVLALAAFVALTSPAFANGTYAEGSIFLQQEAQAQQRPTAPPRRESAELQRLSPRNPLNAPEAGNVWKPSNRDAGNFAAERWSAYEAKRKAFSESVR